MIKKMRKKGALAISQIFILVVGIITPYFLNPHYHWGAALGVFLSCWIALATIKAVIGYYRQQNSIYPRQWAMIIAHLGIALVVAGISLNKAGDETRTRNIQLGRLQALERKCLSL